MLSFNMILSPPPLISFNLRDAYIMISAMGIAAHLIFNRFEPRDPTSILTLLVVIPGILSTILLPHFNHYIFAIMTTLSVYLSVLSLSVIFYRLSPIHPLARYPGPAAFKISKLSVAWISTHGKQHLYFDTLHKKYGDVVRIGPNELSIFDPSAIAPLYGTNGLPKGPYVEGRLMGVFTPSLVTIRDRNLHMQRRTHWLRGLNTAALKGYEPILNNRLRQFVDQLEGSEGSEINLSLLLSHFSYDFMNDMAFGGGSEMMRDGDIHGLWKLQDDGLASATFVGHMPWIVLFGHRFSALIGGLAELRRHGIKAVETRMKKGSQYKDLFYHLIDEGGVNKDPPSLAQVTSDGALAIVAGSDTTASALSHLFYSLLGNPQTYQRLQAEVDKFYPADEDGLSTRFHQKMPYLAACINESLRLFPPAPGGSQRGSSKGMGTTMIGPYRIPEETAVSIDFYVVQRDPRNFSPRSTMFWPERWLVASNLEMAPQDFVHNETVFIPFSYGPANCVGKALVLQEMKTVVCFVMQKVNMRFADGYDPDRCDDVRNNGVLKRLRLPVVVTRRK